MKNLALINQLKADIAKLQERYQTATSREVYKIGAELRAKRKQLEAELNK